MDFKNAVIIDVRSVGEFAGGHVEGSRNIPMDQIPNHIEEIKAIKENIILCCASGARSGAVCEFLKENGIENVSNGGSWSIVGMQMAV